MKTYVILGVLLVAVALGGVYLSRQGGSPSAEVEREVREDGLVQVGGGVLGEDVSAAATIRRTNDGYEPTEVTIEAGQTISFVNESDEFHWPASDVHPTHSIYSEFDPREPVAPGATWSFTFDQAGSWRFHDHLRANYKGTITVEPVH